MLHACLFRPKPEAGRVRHIWLLLHRWNARIMTILAAFNVLVGPRVRAARVDATEIIPLLLLTSHSQLCTLPAVRLHAWLVS
jgi:hypothetical protein